MVDYLNGPDVAALALTDDEIMAAVEVGLAAQGRGETVIEPRVHLAPDASFNGHFNVLRGYIAPMALAGVKVVGDFVDNWQQGLPSEMGLLNLFDPHTGAPVAIIDAAGLTDMRTGAVTAIGAKYLARKGSRVLGHVGARGTAYWNVRLLDRLFDFAEIRVHSRRPESRDAFAERLSRDLGKTVVATADWESCVRGADIVVEASRLTAPEPLLKTAWIARGTFVVPYGTMSAVELSLTDIMDKIVVDDWGQCRTGQFGSLRAHVDAGNSPHRRCTRSWARSSLAANPAAKTTARRSCSGIAGYRRRISPWEQRCSPRRNGWASASSSGMHDPRLLERGCDDRQRAHVCAGRNDRRCVAVGAGVGEPSRGCRVRRRRLPAPQPLAALWARPDLACAFMCGYPFASAAPRPTLLAAPVPSPPQYGGQPVYWTDLIVSAAAPIVDLHDAFGKRIAWTNEDSQSGWHAPRLLLASYARRHGVPLFAETLGPLVTPRNVALAVAEGRADIGPLDSYAHDLLRRHEPALAAALRVIARTPATPIPPLVGAPGMDSGDARQLREALLAVGAAPELAGAREALLLSGFAPVAADAYDALVADARHADALGYPRIA
jgi:ornithine cyclodeaminase